MMELIALKLDFIKIYSGNMENPKQHLNEQAQLTRTTGILGFYTLISRILGLVRDMVIAFFFGAGMAADAFFVAFRIPNLLRRLFAEGSLSMAFIPVFSEYLHQKNKAEAFMLARTVLTLLSIVLVIVVLGGILLAPGIIKILAFGWSGSPEKLQLTVLLTRIMFPYILLISILALFMGILNALRYFAAPAAAPVFLNLAIIGSTFRLAPFFTQPIIGTAIGVLIGGILQLGLQLPWLLREGFSLQPCCQWRHPGIKKILHLFIPALYGSAVYQINQIVITLLATTLPAGSVAWLYYADRLIEFPLGLFAATAGIAALPTLAKLAAEKNLVELRMLFNHSMRFVFFIILPAMVGLIVLRKPIFQILFERGAFDMHATRMSSQAFLYYALGLWAFAGNRIMMTGFYALQDAMIPVKIATITVITNLLLSLVLMNHFQHQGLAMSLTLSSSIQFIILFIILKKRNKILNVREIFISISRNLFSAIVMGLIVFIAHNLLQARYPLAGFPGQVLMLCGLILLGMLIYLVTAKILGSIELSALCVLRDLIPPYRAKNDRII